MKSCACFAIRYGLIILLVLCSRLSIAADMSVVVSIKPVHSIVSGLMRGIGEPTLLIDGSQTPYEFELNAVQKQQISDAVLLVWVGQELEQSLHSAIEKLPQTVQVVELLASEELKILPSRQNPDLRDPYFWMDDRNVLILLDQLTRVLTQIDPSRSHIYSRNRQSMLKPLLKIDREYEYGYRGLQAGISVQYFDTLHYFEQAYALQSIDRVVGSPRDTGSAVHLLKVRNRIVNREANCLLLDKGMSAEHLDILSDGSNVNIAELDTLGLQFEAGPELYIDLMEYNTDTIKRCLNADMDDAAKARQQASNVKGPVIDGVGGRFILTNQFGETITELDMKGQYSLLFFGYTSCPDICPTNMTVMSQALSQMEAEGDRLRAYFITVDPARDNVKVLHEYLGYFDSRLIGLTGSEQMISRVADQFKVKFEKIDVESSGSLSYAMDHTASFYLMAPDGSFITRFAYGISADDLVKELLAVLR